MLYWDKNWNVTTQNPDEQATAGTAVYIESALRAAEDDESFRPWAIAIVVTGCIVVAWGVWRFLL